MRRLVITLAAVLAAYACAPLVLGTETAADLFAPLAREYVREQVPVLASFTARDWSHRAGGAVLLLAGLQQLSGLRRWHRAIGRLYAALASVMSIGGAWMALLVRVVHIILTTSMSEREAMAPAFWIGWTLPLLVLEARR